MQPLKTFQASFQAGLERFLHAKIEGVRRVSRDGFIRETAVHSAQIVRHGGKRIRPYLACLMYGAVGGKKSAEAQKLSRALELFHAFALIHDDIMDRGIVRHGLPTVHREALARLHALRRTGDLEHVSEAHAILAGDLLLSWAHEALDEHALIPASRIARARNVFHQMSEEVIIGQMIDVDLVTRAQVNSLLLLEKMRLKTAGYTFVRPLQFGAALAGANARMMQFCESFGTALGLAFQIQDDLFDLTIPASRACKTVFSDLRERQPTVLTQFIFENGTTSEKRELRTLFGSDLTEKDRPRVQRLFMQSGAVDRAERLIKKYFAEALKQLDQAPLPVSRKKEFHTLVEFIRGRTA